MSYLIKQDYTYVGHDYWTWRAWIEASKEALERISRVVWILHPTFPTPRMETDDRASKFMLTTAGWGTFTLFADLKMKDGPDEHLSHELILENPDKPNMAAESESKIQPVIAKTPTVFLSYGSEEAEHAAELRTTLEDMNVNVTDAYSIKPGDMIAPTVRRLIDKSDAVIGIMGGDIASPFVVQELAQARTVGKPIFTVTSKASAAYGLPKELRSSAVNIDQGDIATSLSSLLGRFGKTQER